MSPQSAALPTFSSDSYALRLVTRSLTPPTPQKWLVQAFIAYHLDYCNSLFCGISDSLFRRLQSVQNAACSAAHNWHQPMRPHHTSVEATPLVTSSTARRVQISKSLHGLTAPYLTDDCQVVVNSGRRRLRSADADTCN